MKILIVSGFLGAGKTTFIKYLAKKINLEFVVLENEYADVGVDKDFLDEDNLRVWEMSEGCICCSMTGDFKKSIRTIYSQINPEYLLIEPTGIGMLSSIIKNIKSINDCEITILNPVTLLDTSSFYEYYGNFEEYFRDNITNTGRILLTRLEKITKSEKEKIKNKILEIKADTNIIDEDYRNLDNNFLKEIFNTDIENKEIISNFNIMNHINLKTFSKINLEINTMDKLGIFLDKILKDDFGKVYRAKGFLKIEGQYGKFNLVHKNFEMESCPPFKENKLIIIGNNLDIRGINEFLEK